MVPNLLSSANNRMVRAGASNMNMTMAPLKNGTRVASGNGSPRSWVKKNPVKARNIRPTM